MYINYKREHTPPPTSNSYTETNIAETSGFQRLHQPFYPYAHPEDLVHLH